MGNETGNKMKVNVGTYGLVNANKARKNSKSRQVIRS